MQVKNSRAVEQQPGELEKRMGIQLTAERLRGLIVYDSDTGAFIWKARAGSERTTKSWNTRYSGLRADRLRVKDGYRHVGINGRLYLAHRLAWLYVYGSWPEKLIDHLNGVRGDNRICNLREADDRTNNENLIRERLDNKSGYLGVYFDRKAKKFRAQIRHNRVAIVVGYFDDPKIAHEAYLSAKRTIHAGCTI